jgi:hypothetical protein
MNLAIYSPADNLHLMDPQSLVIVSRMLERILGVALGGLLIYFGYRLFLDVRGRRAGSGDFSLVGGTRIKLSKVGPGVFFAVFGAGLVVFSLIRPVSLKTSGPAAPGKEAGAPIATLEYLGAASVPETDEERLRRRAETQKHIMTLNRSVERSTAALSPQERADLEEANRRAKLALMDPLWAEDWGDPADFRDWLEKNGTPPPGSAKAVEFFQQQ